MRLNIGAFVFHDLTKSRKPNSHIDVDYTNFECADIPRTMVIHQDHDTVGTACTTTNTSSAQDVGEASAFLGYMAPTVNSWLLVWLSKTQAVRKVETICTSLAVVSS